MAKAARDAYMRAQAKHYPGYGFERHKGYGTPGHFAMLAGLGPTALHRRSFAPVALVQLRQLSLGLRKGETTLI
jgi:ribonuclease HII